MNIKRFLKSIWYVIAFPFCFILLTLSLSMAKRKHRTYYSDPMDLPEGDRYRYVYKMCKKACFMTNMDIKEEGLSSVPKMPVLYVCNHKSSFDPIVLLKIFSENENIVKPVFVAKKEILDNIQIGNAGKLIDTIYMDRSNIRDVYRCIQEEKEVLKNRSVVVFIEGTRINTEEFGEFKGAALEPVYATMRPIVPVVIKGTNGVEKENKKSLFKYKKINVKFMDSIKYKDFINIDKQNIANKLKDMMYKEYQKLGIEKEDKKSKKDGEKVKK